MFEEFTHNDTLVFDAKDMRTTNDGYLTATPRVARTGIQIYLGSELGKTDMDTVRVYRPEAEVMHKDAMSSLAYKPITNDHPSERVTADNWKKYAVGQVGGDIARDGEFIRVPMSLMDKKTIDDVRSGKRELSLGYSSRLDWTPGKTPDGQDYDAMQTQIRINHLAVVDAARGGPKLAIGDKERQSQSHVERLNDMEKTIVVDGVTLKMDGTAAEVVQRALAKLVADAASTAEELANLKKKVAEEKKAEGDAMAKVQTDLATAQVQVATLTKQVADATLTPEKLDAAVADRAITIAKAKATFPAVVVDGKAVSDIQKQTVLSFLGDTAKDYTPEQIKVAFDTMTAKVDVSKVPALPSVVDQMRQTFGGRPATVVNANDKRAEHLNARDERLRNAYKTAGMQA